MRIIVEKYDVIKLFRLLIDIYLGHISEEVHQPYVHTNYELYYFMPILCYQNGYNYSGHSPVSYRYY